MELYLIVGPAGSGKTTAARRILESGGKPIFCVADRTGQLGDKYQTCAWSEVGKLSGCSLLVDDLIGVSQKHFLCLQNLLCYSNTHDDVSPIVICTHLVSKNNVTGLLPAVKKILFTANTANVSALSTVLTHFKFDKATKKKIVDAFLTSGRQFGSFVLDLQSRTAEWGTENVQSGSGGEVGEQQEDNFTPPPPPPPPTVPAERLLARAADPDAAVILYELIWPRLPDNARGRDYCLRLKSGARGGEEVVINLMDLIFCLTDPEERPSIELSSLYNYVRTLVAIPRRLVANQYMQHHSGSGSSGSNKSL
jgi:hypothetical protein